MDVGGEYELSITEMSDTENPHGKDLSSAGSMWHPGDLSSKGSVWHHAQETHPA